jgi:cytochrome bd ubiquinol oxidase subunit I
MPLDVLTLSRLQFALTIMFHYLFPPLSIGLGTLMVIMEGTYLWTKDPQYQAMTKFWTRIFAVNFAMGVATGIVMEFQFGTNWATYSRYVGDVFGSALAAEGIFAFFLESGFLAVLVFGWDRVSPPMHFFATVMVALGSIFSAVWIVVANSWQQTPAGHHLVEAAGGLRAEMSDFWAVVFNPSSVHRLIHVILGAFILGAFFVMSVAAHYLIRRRHEEFAKKTFTLALMFGAVSSLAMGASGHFQARTVARTQPAKLAAFEGHFHTTEGGTPMYLMGVPDPEAAEVKYGVAVPGLLSFLVYDDPSKPVVGLDKFNPEDRPPVVVPFLTYHLMAGLGGAFVGLTLLALFFRWRGTLFAKRWLLWIFVFAVAGAYAANQAGWVAAEQGRQPFIVYPTLQTGPDGQPVLDADGKFQYKSDTGLRTRDALSKSVGADQVLGSIVMFGVVYLLLFAVWVYVLTRKIRHGPDEAVPAQPAQTKPTDLLEVAARLANPSGYSLTDVREELPKPEAREE